MCSKSVLVSFLGVNCFVIKTKNEQFIILFLLSRMCQYILGKNKEYPYLVLFD